MPSTRLSPPFKTTVNDLSFARQWLSAFWTSRRKGSATRIACTEQRLVRLVLDYRCRVRSGADVAFTGRSSFGSMHPTLMMKFFAHFFDVNLSGFAQLNQELIEVSYHLLKYPA